MTRRTLVLLTAVVWTAVIAVPAARAADTTDVMDAAEAGDAFDGRVEVAYRTEYQTALIARERNVQTQRGVTGGSGSGTSLFPGESIDQGEYAWKQTREVLDVKLRAGLWRDIELSLLLPVVLSQTMDALQDEHWRNKYWAGRYDLSGPPAAPPYVEGASLFGDQVTGALSGRSRAAGFGDMRLGAHFGVFDGERDRFRPTWKFGFELTFPTGRIRRPSFNGMNQGAGQGLVVVTLSTDISKRFGAFDPYVGAFVNLPVPVGGAVVKKPQFSGGARFGTEVIFYEQKIPGSVDPRWKFALDVGGVFTMVSEGDAYTPLADMLAWREQYRGALPAGFDANYWQVSNPPAGAGARPTLAGYRLPREQEHALMTGRAGLVFQLFDYLRIRSDFFFAWTFEHYLHVAAPSEIDAASQRAARDVYYRAISDPGDRLKLQEMMTFGFQIAGAITF